MVATDLSLSVETLLQYWPVLLVVAVLLWVAIREFGPTRRLRRRLQ